VRPRKQRMSRQVILSDEEIQDAKVEQAMVRTSSLNQAKQKLVNLIGQIVVRNHQVNLLVKESKRRNME